MPARAASAHFQAIKVIAHEICVSAVRISMSAFWRYRRSSSRAAQGLFEASPRMLRQSAGAMNFGEGRAMDILRCSLSLSLLSDASFQDVLLPPFHALSCGSSDGRHRRHDRSVLALSTYLRPAGEMCHRRRRSTTPRSRQAGSDTIVFLLTRARSGAALDWHLAALSLIRRPHRRRRAARENISEYGPHHSRAL
ncbi:hypothetical protein PYCCODRAFT_1157395 [Trametes coccinea BRFM310]|uniref:Uncharacterized protein n=1 Tax=Trametes coccinea (strain BRFM310) TaxID=1353009 RepID=A0A1Y2IWS5_TRAC3|nr:hypothetical protein PYCCODRAFT_1157395 [Trametes coccinea BRFM310]